MATGEEIVAATHKWRAYYTRRSDRETCDELIAEANYRLWAIKDSIRDLPAVTCVVMRRVWWAEIKRRSNLPQREQWQHAHMWPAYPDFIILRKIQCVAQHLTPGRREAIRGWMIGKEGHRNGVFRGLKQLRRIIGQ